VPAEIRPRNDPAEKLLALLMDSDIRWPDEHTRLAGPFLRDKFDAALAEERRLVVKRIRERIGAARYTAAFDSINRKTALAILDEVEADR
jgi:hypothetical protein